MEISWVTIERWAREKAGPPGAGRTRPYRDDAERLSDGQLLEKLRGFGIELDRTGLEALCQGAFSAQEVASQLTGRYLTEAPARAWGATRANRSSGGSPNGPWSTATSG